MSLIKFRNDNTDECFKHGFSVIGPTGAEIWPFKGYQGYQGYQGLKHANDLKAKAATNGTNSLFFVLPLTFNFEDK
jgi:hypothetical protein